MERVADELQDRRPARVRLVPVQPVGARGSPRPVFFHVARRLDRAQLLRVLRELRCHLPAAFLRADAPPRGLAALRRALALVQRRGALFHALLVFELAATLVLGARAEIGKLSLLAFHPRGVDLAVAAARGPARGRVSGARFPRALVRLPLRVVAQHEVLATFQRVVEDVSRVLRPRDGYVGVVGVRRASLFVHVERFRDLLERRARDGTDRDVRGVRARGRVREVQLGGDEPTAVVVEWDGARRRRRRGLGPPELRAPRLRGGAESVLEAQARVLDRADATRAAARQRELRDDARPRLRREERSRGVVAPRQRERRRREPLFSDLFGAQATRRRRGDAARREEPPRRPPPPPPPTPPPAVPSPPPPASRAMFFPSSRPLFDFSSPFPASARGLRGRPRAPPPRFLQPRSGTSPTSRTYRAGPPRPRRPRATGSRTRRGGGGGGGVAARPSSLHSCKPSDARRIFARAWSDVDAFPSGKTRAQMERDDTGAFVSGSTGGGGAAVTDGAAARSVIASP